MGNSEIKTDVLSPEGGEAERYRRILTLVGGDEELACQLIRENKSVDEVRAEFAGNTRQKSKDDKPATWDTALKQQMTETNCSEADAVRFCVREYPELHEKFLQGLKTPPKPEFTEFWDKVEKHVEKTSCDKSEAIRFCMERYPELISFWAAVEHHMKKVGCGKVDAVRFCVREFPELHEVFLQEQAKAAANDMQSEPDQAADFMATVREYAKKKKCSEADAVRFCVHQYPELHQAFLEKQRQNS